MTHGCRSLLENVRIFYCPHTCIEPPAPFSQSLAPTAYNMSGLYADRFFHKVESNVDSVI